MSICTSSVHLSVKTGGHLKFHGNYECFFTDVEYPFVYFAAEVAFQECCACFPYKVLPGNDQVNDR